MKKTGSSGQTKHQIKTEATLRALLEAAETVFVRDGYERAQIETIAAEAGRTKGAVYAHFRSKQDIFFALLEKKASVRHEAFKQLTESVPSKAPIQAMRALFLGALDDESWQILMLEFKLFAMRNKDSLRRVRGLYQLLYDGINRFLVPRGAGFTDAQRRRVVIGLAVLRGIPNAVLLEKQFNPVLDTPGVARQALETIFGSLLHEDDFRPRRRKK